MSFSNFYGVKGYSVLEEYYRLRAEEEYLHHRWIKDYLNENDVEYKYPNVPEISEQFEDMVTPFELTVDKEIETIRSNTNQSSQITGDSIYDVDINVESIGNDYDVE